jgi:hypothetical protein
MSVTVVVLQSIVAVQQSGKDPGGKMPGASPLFRRGGRVKGSAETAESLRRLVVAILWSYKTLLRLSAPVPRAAVACDA